MKFCNSHLARKCFTFLCGFSFLNYDLQVAIDPLDCVLAVSAKIGKTSKGTLDSYLPVNG